MEQFRPAERPRSASECRRGSVMSERHSLPEVQTEAQADCWASIAQGMKS
jgi:hypothetical protein